MRLPFDLPAGKLPAPVSRDLPMHRGSPGNQPIRPFAGLCSPRAFVPLPFCRSNSILSRAPTSERLPRSARASNGYLAAFGPTPPGALRLGKRRPSFVWDRGLQIQISSPICREGRFALKAINQRCRAFKPRGMKRARAARFGASRRTDRRASWLHPRPIQIGRQRERPGGMADCRAAPTQILRAPAKPADRFGPTGEGRQREPGPPLTAIVLMGDWRDIRN